MADSVPSGRRIDRPALERIIQRAAELQAREREIGDGLTEAELLQLGEEVGIPSVYLQQALFEEQTRAVAAAERGMLTWLAGPRMLAAERTVTGTAQDVEAALHHWMTDSELLTVKRRYPDRTGWEARGGTFATLKRSLGAGGRSYRLARAREIVTQVVGAHGSRCHVRLLADLGNTRRHHLGGAAGLAVTGTGLTAVAFTLGIMVPIAVIPIPLGLAIGFGLARARRAELDRVQVALEQILDKLEHGEIGVRPKNEALRQHPLSRIADEIRRRLGD